MKTFFKKVDTRSREAMVAFLSGHFRYDTMNSWNRSTSYAQCVKVHRLDLTREQLDKAWGMLDMAEVFDAIHSVLQDWAAEREWRWQVGFNGRSGGYLVLYQGGMDYKNAKTAQCDVCGKLIVSCQECGNESVQISVHATSGVLLTYECFLLWYET